MAGRPPAVAVRSRVLWCALAASIPLISLLTAYEAITRHPAKSLGALGLWLLLVLAVWLGAQSSVAETVGADRRDSGHHGPYRRLLAEHLDRVDLAGVTTQGDVAVRLTDVYVDLRMRPEGGGGPEIAFVGTSHDPGAPKPFMSTLRKRRHSPVLVVGEPGAGKTTALRRAALHTRRVPIYLELRHHTARLCADAPPALPELAADAGWLGGQIPAEWFARRLNRGGCVVLLDGLDEIPSEAERRKVVGWIREQFSRYPKNACVVTSRPGGLKGSPLAGAETWQLRRLTDEQISGFVYSWCRAVEVRRARHSYGWIRDETAAEAGVLLSRLRANPALYALARNPLVLTLIARINRHCGLFPSTRAQLYADACDLMLHRLGGGAFYEDAATKTRGAQRFEVVRRLAHHLMDTRRTTITVDDARSLLADVLTGVRPRRIPEAVLFEAVDAGLLNEVGDGVLAFSHLSMQEFLAARELHWRANDADVAAKTGDPWWRDAILLWSTEADATRVVEACLRTGHVTGLSLAYDLAEHSLELASDVRLRLKRLLAEATESLPQSRLLGGVKSAREMRETIRLPGGARLAARPVSASLYSSFLDSEFPSRDSRPSASHPEGPAVGMWASDAQHLVEWLNGLPRDDGANFRLPTESELSDPGLRLDASVAHSPMWVSSEPHPKLFGVNGHGDPYALGDGWWGRQLAADRRRGALSLYLVSQALGASARDLTRDLSGELNLNRDRAYLLPRELDSDTDLRAARVFLRPRDLSPGAADTANPAATEHVRRVVSTVFRLCDFPTEYRRANTPASGADTTFAFTAGLSDAEKRLMASAYTLLWFSRRRYRGKHGYGQAIEEFDAYVAAEVFPDSHDRAKTVTPEGLLESLSRAQRMVDAAPRGNVLFDLGRDLMSSCTEVLNSSLVHSRASGEQQLVSARASLTAVAAVARGAGMPVTETRRLVSQLSTVVAGLSILEARASGAITPREVILLVQQ